MGFLDLKRALVIENSDLQANGGRYCITSGPAIQVRSASDQEATQPSIPVPIYVIEDADLRENGGNYLVESGVARPVSPVHESEQVVGRWAQPVYADPDDAGFYPTFEFSEALSAFTPAMAKRNGAAAGPFAAGPLMQGNWDGTGVPDQMTFPRGNLIGNATRFWYDNYDPYQGSVVFWITPEWDGNDGLLHTVFLSCVTGIQYLTKEATNVLRAYFGGGVLDIDVSAWTAGTTYSIVLRWDSKQTLDGTNHICISIDGAHTFGRPAYTEDGEPEVVFHLGGNVAGVNSIEALIEGFFIFRRPLFDGTFGVDVGNGDEIALLAAGADPCLFTGSWDVTFGLPTNATVEEIVTGPGEAWSHPHNANVVEHGWNDDGGYLSGPYAPIYNATTTSAVVADHANIQDLHGGTFTAEAYIRADGWGESNLGRIFDKTTGVAEGWNFLIYNNVAGGLGASVKAATSAFSFSGLDEFTPDGKWHHVAMTYDNGGARTIALWIDGIPISSYVAQDAAVGLIGTDVGNDLYIGNRSDSTTTFDGAIGWARLSDNLRYTAGVGFVAPRQPPAVDGNTVAQWEMDEGTGGTLDNETGVAALDATITNHVWEAQWDMEGTPLIPRSVEYDGTTTSCVVADAARIQDLHAGEMTAEAWIRADSYGELNSGRIFDKTATLAEGWRFELSATIGLSAYITVDTTPAWSACGLDEFVADGKWHLITMMFDGTALPAGNPVISLWVDGIPVASYTSQQAGVGAIVTDVGNDLYIGNNSTGAYTFDGSLGGWCRLSDSLRYTAGEAFVPPSRGNPPAPDANTAWQTDYSDGAGATLTDDSAGANNGTLSNYVWRNTPDMEVDAPGQRVYPWGYVFDVDAANEGYTEVLTGLDAGENYVVRVPLQYERDRRAWPRVRIRDETNGANIVDFDGPKLYGTHTGANGSADLISAAGEFSQSLVGATVYNITDLSLTTSTSVSGDKTTIVGTLAGGTDDDWDNGDVFMIVPPNENAWVWCEPFCFELPTIARNGVGADCVSISVKVLNRNDEGTIYAHQLELLENLVDNPSLETGAGNPWIPNGWANDGLAVGESVQDVANQHSGAACPHVTEAADGGMRHQTVLAFPNFFSVGSFAREISGSGEYQDAFPNLIKQTSATARIQGNWDDSAWKLYMEVGRSEDNGTIRFLLRGLNASEWLIDDVYIFQLDDITLTVTPANQLNSAEGTGLRVDGRDTCIQPITDIGQTRGRITFRYTPRHDAADVALFGELTSVVGTWYGNANNWIMLDWSAANTIRLQYNSSGAGVLAGAWNAVGAIVAGVTYDIDIRYSPTVMQLRVDDVLRIEIVNNVDFTTIPINAYWGTDQPGVQQNDFTIDEPA